MLEAHISVINKRKEDGVAHWYRECIIQQVNGGVYETPFSCKEICGINADNLHEWR